jgi:hypothetical protein
MRASATRMNIHHLSVVSLFGQNTSDNGEEKIHQQIPVPIIIYLQLSIETA